MKRHAVPIEWIGIAGLVLPMASATFAFDMAKQGAKRVDHIVRWTGRRKYLDEVESARKASAIAEQGYEHSFAQEFELSAELFCHLKAPDDR
jgi:hypothetical protein